MIPGEEVEEVKEQKEEPVENLVERLKKKLERERAACLYGFITLEMNWNKDGSAGRLYTDDLQPEFAKLCQRRITTLEASTLPYTDTTTTENITVSVVIESKKITFKKINGDGSGQAGYTGTIKCANGFKARARMIKSKDDDW